MRLLGPININHTHPTHDPPPDYPQHSSASSASEQRAARTAPELYPASPASSPQLSWWIWTSGLAPICSPQRCFFALVCTRLSNTRLLMGLSLLWNGFIAVCHNPQLVLVVPVQRQASANCLISACHTRRYTADTLVLERRRSTSPEWRNGRVEIHIL